MAELAGSFILKRTKKLVQWYVVLDLDFSDRSNQHRHHLSTIPEISSIHAIGHGAHIVTGPSSTPLRLSSAQGVRWVGKRPDRHKLDPTLLHLTENPNATDTTQDWRNLTGDEARLTAGAVQRTHWRRVFPGEPLPHPSRVNFVRSVVALLSLSPGAPSAARLAGQWGRRFARKGWDADAMVAADDRIVVHLDYSRGGGSGGGGGGSLLARVVGWRAGRAEVVWVEPRAAHAPAARYASALLAFGRGTAADLTGAQPPASAAAGGGIEDLYAPSAAARAAVEAVLTSPAYTGSWDVTSEPGPGLPGDFCAYLPRAEPGSAGGGLVRGAAGANPGFLRAAAAGLVLAASRDNATVTLAGAGLAGDDGAYDGYAVAFCGAVGRPAADCDLPGAANFTIVRYLAGPPATAQLDPIWPASGAEARSPAAGQAFRIRPALQPGDTVALHAFAAAVTAAYTPDALAAAPPPAAAAGGTAAAAFRPPRCAAAGAGPPAARAGLPPALWALGYRRLRSTCRAAVPVRAALDLPVPAAATAAGCAAHCAGLDPGTGPGLPARWARAGLCGPVNVTAGEATGWRPGVCTCSMLQVPPPRRLPTLRPSRPSRHPPPGACRARWRRLPRARPDRFAARIERARAPPACVRAMTRWRAPWRARALAPSPFRLPPPPSACPLPLPLLAGARRWCRW